jgi:glycosyltransferase involved in cell wall biosynthesis
MGVPDLTDAPGLKGRAPEPSREALRERLGVSGHVVLTLGRLVPIKGLDVLVQALRGVPDMTLVVAGDGPDRARLARQARVAGVRVAFPGVVLGEDKRAWLRAADVFALPSRRLPSGREEGTPTALLEAMLAGVPVVATDTGGVGELLRGRELAPEPRHGAQAAEREVARGLLVPPDNADALRRAIIATLSEPERARTRAQHALAAARAQTWAQLAAPIDALVRGA